MLTATVSDANVKQVIEHLHSSHTRLHRLLEDVRHFAGPMLLEKSTCSLEDIWQHAWSSLANARQDREAELHETIICPNLNCQVDALRIEQVFRNLLENSLAACPDPLWIEIHASEIQHNGKPALRISVRDNGPGLSQEAKSKVFEPFFTTKQRGTGLGMAISERILKAHGGELGLSNTNKRGAEFLLVLPLEKPD
jgi:signal transduction histidine kinase